MLEQHPKRAEAILVLYLALLVMGQLLRWQVTPTLAVYPVDILSVLLFVPAVLTFKSRWWCWWKRHSILTHWLMLILLSWVLIGWAMAMSYHFDITGSVLRWARVVVHSMSSWYLVYHVRERSAKWWVSVLWLLGISWGWIQYLVLPDMRWLAVFGWDDHYFRMVGAFFDPNYMGVWCVMSLVWFWRQQLPRTWLWLITAVISAAIAVTFSRASYLALGLSVGWWVSRSGKASSWQSWGLAVLTLITVGISIVLAPKPGGEGVNLARTASTSARFTATKEWLPSTGQQWLFGQGLGVRSGATTLPVTNDLRANHSQLPDSLLVLLLSGLGVGGMLVVVCLVWQLRTEWWSWPVWLQAIWIAVLVHAQFNNTLFQPMIWSWLMVVTLLSTTNRTRLCELPSHKRNVTTTS